jgi:hypothetical protein
MLAIRCDVLIIDPNEQPPSAEARFVDATGRLITIRDKEPIFVDSDSLPGHGVVRCFELSRRTVGARTVVTVSLDSPDGLETTDGHQVVEVFDSLLEEPESSA